MKSPNTRTDIFCRALLFVSALFVAACQSGPGNYLTAASPDVQSLIAEDAAAQLARVHRSPTLHLAQQPADPFGRSLVDALRQAGYTVITEIKNPAPKNTSIGGPYSAQQYEPQNTSNKTSGSRADSHEHQKTGNAKTLAYTIDDLGNPNMLDRKSVV